MQSDRELLEAWQGGDAGAGETLFRRYFDRACRFFYNKVDHGVEDLIQQTFLACLENRERFRGDSSFFTFLIGVGKNVLRLHYRRQRRDARIDFHTTSVFDLSPSPSRIVAQRMDEQRVLDGLRKIPIELQIVLELHYWEEMSATRVAETLEIPVGTAKTRLRRGKQLLREQLDEGTAGETATNDDALDDCAARIRRAFPGTDPPDEA
ncbi:MAG: sigma-70 family RNA polymerase sigma factor [Myxococcota bacterium]